MKPCTKVGLNDTESESFVSKIYHCSVLQLVSSLKSKVNWSNNKEIFLNVLDITNLCRRVIQSVFLFLSFPIFAWTHIVAVEAPCKNAAMNSQTAIRGLVAHGKIDTETQTTGEKVKPP